MGKSNFCLKCKRGFTEAKRFKNTNLCVDCFQKGVKGEKIEFGRLVEMRCPRDATILKQVVEKYLECEKCKGTFYYGQEYNREFEEALSDTFLPTIAGSKLICPTCRKEMQNLQYRYGRLRINRCEQCKGIWLDKNEEEVLQRIIKKQKSLKIIYLSGKASQKEKKLLERYKEYEGDKKTTGAETFFQIMSGLPVERNLKPFNVPFITYILIAVNIIVFLISLSDLREFVYSFGYIPQNREYIKIIYSMFIHGGFLHVLGNMYFLWIMGDNVEDVIGPWKYLALYFLAGIISGYIGGLIGAQNLPHIGASGAVASMMAAYLLLFPRARFLLRFYIFIVVPVPSIIYLLFWVGYQFIIAVRGGTNVSWSAHIAGYVVGLIFIFIEKQLMYREKADIGKR